MMQQAPAETGATLTGVQRSLTEIRHMIVSAELLPGQKVHQGQIAQKLNLSRIPVREALSTLLAEGVLAYKANTGFTVVNFSGEDLAQVYLMRQLLEKEVLRSIDLSKVDIDELVQLNDDLAACSQEGDTMGQLNANDLFHFSIYNYSPLTMVRKEIERLWSLSSSYRSFYIYDPNSSKRVLHDHAVIIEAIRSQNVDELVRASDTHRRSTEDLVLKRLQQQLS